MPFPASGSLIRQLTRCVGQIVLQFSVDEKLQLPHEYCRLKILASKFLTLILTAKICKQIDERRQASCRVRPLAVGAITKRDRFHLFGEIAVTVVFKYGMPLVGTLRGLPNPVNGSPYLAIDAFASDKLSCNFS